MNAVYMASEAQGRVPAAGRIPGNYGIWIGILIEMTEFALLFTVYFVARLNAPQAFSAGPASLNTLTGTMNTLFLISGSFFVARAVLAIRQDRSRSCLLWLLLVLAMAVGYGVVKYHELQWNAAHGITGTSGLFFTVYYYLTFTHMVHVGWGLIGLSWVIARTAFGAYTSEAHDGIEAFASYWHATDLIWLLIFPMVYLLR